MLESVRTKMTTSWGYKPPCIFIEVVLLCYDFCGTQDLQNVGILEKSIMIIKIKYIYIYIYIYIYNNEKCPIIF
jgi:hypothetical protein